MVSCPKYPRTKDSKFSQKVFALLGKRCIVPGCQTPFYLVQAHHCWSKGQNGDDVVENGIPLCDCHHVPWIHADKSRLMPLLEELGLTKHIKYQEMKIKQNHINQPGVA